MTSGVDELHHRALQVPLQEIPWAVLNRRDITLLVRRDDLISRHLSGNKFYKLFYNLKAARALGFNQILSFGGAYSNHLYALAAAGFEAGIETIGVVRGERPAQLSPTLKDVETWGMKLHFIGRDAYRNKTDAALLTDLRNIYGDFYLIPEGGANIDGVRGAAVMGWAIEQQLEGDYSCVCVPCGTGSTLAGISMGLPENKPALGFSVLKGKGDSGAAIADHISCLTRQKSSACETSNRANWRLISGYHAGGYGRKLPKNLLHFWQLFETETGLLLDPVYGLKMFWGIANLVSQDYWPKGSRIVVVHTGGLQGRRGFEWQLVPL